MKKKRHFKIFELLKPTILKIIITFILLIFLPIYPCEMIGLAECIAGGDCSSISLGFEYKTLNGILQSYPICNNALLIVPVYLIITYLIISGIVYYLKNRTKKK